MIWCFFFELVKMPWQCKLVLLARLSEAMKDGSHLKWGNNWDKGEDGMEEWRVAEAFLIIFIENTNFLPFSLRTQSLKPLLWIFSVPSKASGPQSWWMLNGRKKLQTAWKPCCEFFINMLIFIFSLEIYQDLGPEESLIRILNLAFASDQWYQLINDPTMRKSWE